jgi:hypothetical protein
MVIQKIELNLRKQLTLTGEHDNKFNRLLAKCADSKRWKQTWLN